MTTETVAERGVQTTISSWAIAIREAMANTLSGIFNTGIVLADCKAELPHGDWLEAVRRAGMSPRTAQRFLSIATNGALVEAALQGDIYVNATSVSHLPASWSTLYELSRIPTSDLIGSAHEIHPFMTHSEARALRQRIKDENQQRRPAPAATEPSDPELLKRATSLADEFVDGVRPSDINWTNKPLKSIWGDCRTWGGHILINTLLGDAPAFVLDAVIVHELAHLLHPHHGKTFKAIADRYPRQLEAEAYLRGMSYARGAPTESGVRQVFVDGLLSACPSPRTPSSSHLTRHRLPRADPRRKRWASSHSLILPARRGSRSMASWLPTTTTSVPPATPSSGETTLRKKTGTSAGSAGTRSPARSQRMATPTDAPTATSSARKLIRNSYVLNARTISKRRSRSCPISSRTLPTGW